MESLTFSNRKFCKLLLKSFHSCMRRATLRLHSLSMLSMERPSASVVQYNSSGFSLLFTVCVCVFTWAVSVQPVTLGFVGFCLMEVEKLPHAVVSSVESPAKSPCGHTIYHRALWTPILVILDINLTRREASSLLVLVLQLGDKLPLLFIGIQTQGDIWWYSALLFMKQ